MKMEIDKAVIQRRVRISLLSPALYLSAAGISLAYPALALCLYAAVPAYFAFGTLSHSGSPKQKPGTISDEVES